MSKAMQLQQSVLQDVAYLLDDKEAMKKLQKFLQHLKSEKAVREESISQGADLGNGIHKVRMAISNKGKSKSNGARVDTITDKEIANLMKEL